MARRSAGNSLIKNCDIHPSASIDSSKLGTVALAKLATGALPTGVTVTESNLSGGLSYSSLPNIARVVGLAAVPQKNATKVAGSLAGNSATHAFTIETDPIDVPRNLEVSFAASWDGGAVTVTGTDQFGATQTETFATGSNVVRVGSKIFATVESAVKAAQGANAAGATIGTGAKVGVGVDLSDSSGVAFNATTGAVVPGTFSSTYDSFTPTVEPNNDEYIVIVNV